LWSGAVNGAFNRRHQERLLLLELVALLVGALLLTRMLLPEEVALGAAAVAAGAAQVVHRALCAMVRPTRQQELLSGELVRGWAGG